MHSKPILLTFISATIFTLNSQAKPEREYNAGNRLPPAPDQVIELLDVDGSGSITEDEAKGPLAKYFDRIDSNGDGEISEEELLYTRKNRGQKPKQGRADMKTVDTDKNGTISIQEAAQASLKKIIEKFERIDADGDGEISKEEMHQLRKQIGKREQDTK